MQFGIRQAKDQISSQCSLFFKHLECEQNAKAEKDRGMVKKGYLIYIDAYDLAL